ncbi:Phosphosulfolactate synthase [Desulfofarcimen acetoxidans DSM 771]|uniref:Phosphosulfolactate synthase n=1 Tax=Desulfofarcimen acetoxidans (strain ATCC 49208 / DSM 771 / KCTC 5769 / VKM B-1644 / 5575) TaxID=485916 RepID=C8W0B5_DESAS|nr:phosphosulfolactate synthase [Desulfofarcimen acetoxidans]ACV63170.1 Phosphosulfolactate synthase [Desulfofarcimen acetoxidans DSM 771]
MSEYHSSKTWRQLLRFPLDGRDSKPRAKGLTMIIDNGLGLGETRDLLTLVGDYIDFIKLGFGTSALYSQNLLEEKISMALSFNIDIYPGGTFFEIAVLQDSWEEFIIMAKHIGFTAIEVSDGTIKIPDEIREKAISLASSINLKVLTEIGQKDPRDQIPLPEMLSQIKKDVDCGADWIIVEGRESGQNAGVYDHNGCFIMHQMEEIVSVIPDPSMLIWEAPLKQQQQELIMRFGPNVNIGNIAPHEVLALEALRSGLRGDTLRFSCNNIISRV